MEINTHGIRGMASGTVDFAGGGKTRHCDCCKRNQSGSKEKFFYPRTVAAGFQPGPHIHSVRVLF